MSETFYTEAPVARIDSLGEASRGHVTLAQFQQQLVHLCQELNAFSDLVVVERQSDESQAGRPTGVERLFDTISRQVLGRLPSRPTPTTSARVAS